MPQFIPSLTSLKKAIVASIAIVLLAFAPVGAVFADDPTPCTPPDQSIAGVHWPTGSDASMFSYQCTGDYSGKWLSAHYVFDPSDNSRTPLTPIVYTYNSSTDQYTAPVWDFNAAQGAYQLDTISVANPPAGATVSGSRPAPVAPTTTDTGSNTPQANVLSTDSAADPSGNTGINLNGTNNTNINNGTTVSATTGIVSFAGTGNATVAGNTTGGNAATGSSQTVADVVNMLQSSSNAFNNPNLVTFTANIDGDVTGDFLLDPAQLGAVQPANVSTSLDNNVKVNNTTNSTMNNTIDLGASSGNAAVSGNTSGGDATSGNAAAVAHITNLLNSYVTAGKSFIGVININGNLNGDILLPPDFVDTLLASNVPHYDIATNVTNNATVANVNNATINNNVTSAANTGNATVSDNTGAGSATTGSATTKVTVFNLTGSQVVASNDLLVFVNVLGSWYGMILNAPVGTTAASLGGGVVSNTVNNDATLNNTNNQTINNNVNVKARSGDATVSRNTSGGNAKTGDASTVVDITNMINNRLTLNGWFGLLFINVFGSWNGSFGINTSAGDPVPAPQSSGAGAGAPMFQFVPASDITPTDATTHQSNSGGTATGTSGDASTTGSHGAVLAAKSIKSPAGTPQLAQDGSSNYLIPLLGGGLALAILAFSERNRFIHRST